jgi:hypothetical protein
VPVAVERVVALEPDHEVVPAAAVDGVLAEASNEAVVGAVARDRAAERAPLRVLERAEGVDLAAEGRRRAARQVDGHGALVEVVGHGVTERVVRASGDGVVAGAGADEVVARVTVERVGSLATGERVGSRTAVHRQRQVEQHGDEDAVGEVAEVRRHARHPAALRAGADLGAAGARADGPHVGDLDRAGRAGVDRDALGLSGVGGERQDAARDRRIAVGERARGCEREREARECGSELPCHGDDLLRSGESKSTARCIGAPERSIRPARGGVVSPVR